jgi:hypothetical protein
MIWQPPVDDGAFHDTVADALPATAVTLVGAVGVPHPLIDGLSGTELRGPAWRAAANGLDVCVPPTT